MKRKDYPKPTTQTCEFQQQMGILTTSEHQVGPRMKDYDWTDIEEE